MASTVYCGEDRSCRTGAWATRSTYSANDITRRFWRNSSRMVSPSDASFS
jgi:hypothetical protein